MVGHLQQAWLLEHASDQLQTDRQPLGIKAAGQADRRQASHVGGNGEQVGQVHGQGVLGVGAEGEGRGRRGGGEQHIHALEGRIKIAADQGAHLLGLLVVSIHVARRKGIGTDQDAPLHLIAKPFSAATGRHLGQAVTGRLAAAGAVAVFDAVIAGQVGGRLRGGDHVVGGDAVVEAGAADIDQLTAQGLEGFGGGHHGSSHLGGEPIGAEAFAHDPHPQPLDRLR